MFRRLPRFLATRVGRSLLILAALGLLWAAWWIWPERPLREIKLDAQIEEVTSISPDGKLVALSDRMLRSLIPADPLSKVIRLDDGKTILNSEIIKRDYVTFDRRNQNILLCDDEGFVRYLGPTGKELDEVKMEPAIATAELHYAGSGFGWNAIPNGKMPLANQWWRQFLNWVRNNYQNESELYEVQNQINGAISRRIYGERWCGFAHNDRGWTADSDGFNHIILREWDVSFARPPFWLWLVSGVCVGYVFKGWMANYPSRQR